MQSVPRLRLRQMSKPHSTAFALRSDLVDSSLKSNSGTAFAPAERDVYSNQRTHQNSRSGGAKPGSGTIAQGEQSDCAPPELPSKQKNRQAINISPSGAKRRTACCCTSNSNPPFGITRIASRALSSLSAILGSGLEADLLTRPSWLLI